MLLIDGVKYEEWIPANEDEFEQEVKKHDEDIFSKDSIYFEKQKLKSKAGIGSIPDGFVIILGDQPQWHIVEVELSSHAYEHIAGQVSRFINGIKNPSTQRKIVDALYQEIDNDEFDRLRFKKAIGTTDIHKFLSDLISEPAVLTIIIEKHTKGVDEALSMLAYPPENKKVVEFRTFTREGIGLKVHAHSFEPIRKPTVVKEPTPVEVPEETWSKQEILEFWNLLTEDAKAALRVIAKQPDGCPRDDVLAELEIDGRQLSGRMSSVGHTLHNFPTKLRPVELDESTWKYKMIAELSRAVAELSL